MRRAREDVFLVLRRIWRSRALTDVMLCAVFEGRACEAECTILVWFCHRSFDISSEVSHLSSY